MRLGHGRRCYKPPKFGQRNEYRVRRHPLQQRYETERAQWQQKYETDRAQWQQTFESERQKGVSDWQVQFLHDLVTWRVEAYPAVLRTLGAVPDVEGDDDHLAAVRDLPERLLEAVGELLEHLYGEAGLVMSMGTRNRLHDARLKCLEFQKGAVSRKDLVPSSLRGESCARTSRSPIRSRSPLP